MVVESFWQSRSVFLTGHTGFMGGWLSSYLLGQGADITGYSLEPPTHPSFFQATLLVDKISTSIIGDIRDQTSLTKALVQASPSVVFHLAAQPLVRRANVEPHLTFETNIMGTVNLMEAVRNCSSVKALLVVTTDKVYENKNWQRPYTEDDRLGGKEPYSASKAGSEFALDAYRNIFFRSLEDKDNGVGLASIRSGNIIGGGDWAEDRLVPDAIKRFTQNQPLRLRKPGATRPWQHVLDPIPGYLTLAEKLCERPSLYSSGWNFGPTVAECKEVSWVAERLCSAWGDGARFEAIAGPHIFEEHLLALDSSKAASHLRWTPSWPLRTAIERAVEWYKTYYDGGDVWLLTRKHCEEVGLNSSISPPAGHNGSRSN